MSTVAKILVVLNLVLAGFFLASASNYLGNQDSFRDKLNEEKTAHAQTRSDLETRVAELEGTLRAQAKDMNSIREERGKLQAENGRLDASVTHAREAYDQLAENQTRAQRAVDQLTSSLNATRSLNDALTKDNTQLREALRVSQADRDAKVAMVNSLQMQLQNETEARKATEVKLAAAEEDNKRKDFRLAWYTEKFPGAEASEQPAHSGRVLASADGGVVVISLGEEDGVKPGFQYTVARGNKYIGTIQISTVQAKQSAGFVLKDLSKGDVQTNDQVMSGR
jgi:chromosome segregation ATPase